METMCLKLDAGFARDIERIRKKHHYTTKTEFVREAIRKLVQQLETEEAIMRAKALYGFSKRRTTDAELHRAREKAFEELEKEL